MIILGLTGSIGMGKSTTAQMFADEGAYVWDADAAVHRAYAKGGPGIEPIRALVPEAVRNETVDRLVLRDAIISDPMLLKKVEAAIHPIIANDRADFLQRIRLAGARVAVLDIPLIFETASQGNFDCVAVVSAPADIQRARVLERPGMTEEAFEAILAKQVPDAEKRALADYVIETGNGFEATRQTVKKIMKDLTGDAHYA